MGVTTAEMFGDAAPQLATPGSYGQAPANYRLPEGTRLGVVRLQIADLDRSLRYYVEVLGFRIAERSASSAALASHDGGRVVLELHERAGAAPSGGARLGLYHFAILLPDRPSLARFVQHLADAGERAGAGDHLVSEAFYLTDPDGLGIEVYADRPRETWHRLGRELMIATDPVDVDGLLASAGASRWSGMPGGTVIGHVHLKVGDLDRGAAFYGDALGFDRMTWRYPGALFLGAGGYHHHVGTNTWAGAGAAPAAEGDARLLEWTIEVPDAGDVDAVRASLERAGHPLDEADHETVRTRDPWGTRVHVRALPASSAESATSD